MNIEQFEAWQDHLQETRVGFLKFSEQYVIEKAIFARFQYLVPF